MAGLDIRPYQEDVSKCACFIQQDITGRKLCPEVNDFVVCISVLEHIQHQSSAIINMYISLKQGGKLLLTIPTKIYAQGHNFKGFDYWDLLKLTNKFFKIIDYREVKGQIFACLIKNEN